MASIPAAEAPARRIALINPRFEPSFWGFDYALPLYNGAKRCWMVTGALPALAALVPEGWEVELFDENVDALDFEHLRTFDVVGVTGMIVQRQRMQEILTALRGARGRIVVGGPYVSVDEEAFEGLCDTRFVGEAEETWPAYLAAVAAGEPTPARYEQAAKTDMTTVPTPRYDLMQPGRYMTATLQFSRGCPFLCEFCDIITIFGRRPRLKTPQQVLNEVEALWRAGWRTCFVVDDNFIGNKAEVKKLLPLLIEWQRAHGFPMLFSTEASINLADDAELIALMAEANFRQVFIGIESPRAASLAETRKVQNIRGDSMLAKIGRVRDGGLVVQAGFIVGFDNDDADIFAEQKAFIEESGIGQATVAILAPVPTTPLYARLKAEGRLDASDPEVAFRPARMSQRELREGHTRLLRDLYSPQAYLGRVFRGYGESAAFRARRRELAQAMGQTGGALTRLMTTVGALGPIMRLAMALLRRGELLRLGRVYLRYYGVNRRFGREALGLSQYVGLLLQHWHFFNIAWHPSKTTFGNAGVPEHAGESVLMAAE